MEKNNQRGGLAVQTEQKQLDSNAIKLIAILAMTVDHIAWAIFPGYDTAPLPLLMHLLGRITCPIMCYFIAEGYHHTRNVRKYTARLFLFALISHFAYRFFSVGFCGWRSFLPFADGRLLDQTGVLWSLAWGLVMLRIAHSTRIRSELTRTLLILLICLVSLPADWSCIAALCILAFGTNRGNFRVQMGWMVFYCAIYAVVYCLALDPIYGILQMGTVLAIPILRRYNGGRSGSQAFNRVMKWVFYLYYPLHLFVIGLFLHGIL